MPIRKIIEYVKDHPKTTAAAIAAAAVMTLAYVSSRPRKNRYENGQETDIIPLYSALNSVKKGEPCFV